MLKHVIERDVPGAAKVPPLALRSVSWRSGGIVTDVGSDTELIQSLVVGSRVYRVRVSDVRTIDPTTDDD